MSAHISFLAIAVIVILLALLWIIDTLRLRAAAKKIDASFRKLAREPHWVPLQDPSFFDDKVIARLDSWDELCSQQLNLKPLVRLQEQYTDGQRIGVRTVLVSEDRSIAATFACSHKDTNISFRSFISVIDSKMLIATDARFLSDRPDNHIVGSFDKSATEVDMLEKLFDLRRQVPGDTKGFVTPEAYVAVQQTMRREANAIREKKQYVIDLNTLRKYAPPNLSESRLRRIHGYIVKLHQ